MHGGELIARVIKSHGVKSVFTLCGGHISPILSACKQTGIRIIDVRNEATAVFAADAVSRVTGIPGVAVVTAGPGLTNTITAIKNAQMAQSAVVILGGATATALKGRGALQDIDQIALVKPHVKWYKVVQKVRDLATAMQDALTTSQEGLPGPVFVECPVDLLYEEKMVREWYGLKSGKSKTISGKLQNLYLSWHVNRLFSGQGKTKATRLKKANKEKETCTKIHSVSERIQKAQKPLLLIGSQAVMDTANMQALADAISRLGIPVYLSGMARGLLGKNNPLQMRHQRRLALKEADCVLLAGVPCDFRLNYGRHIGRNAFLISVNRSREDLKKNRRPDIAIKGDAGDFLCELAPATDNTPNCETWHKTLNRRDGSREQEIIEQSQQKTELVNPLHFFVEMEKHLDENSILVADGGDFVATASYILRPPKPLSWLDPGVFGTLGVGAGFAMGAKLSNPQSVVWIIYGDGSFGYSLMEFDTFARHKIPIIAVIGNDASWAQIAREQVEILKDDVATVLNRSDYHLAAEALGAKGFLITSADQISPVLQQAKKTAQQGVPVVINVHISQTDFRKGSISM